MGAGDYDSWVQTAFRVSEAGTCSRRKVGAIIIKSRVGLVAWGANGALNGFKPCDTHTDFTPCSTSEHAERQALYMCCREGISTVGTALIATDAPCHGCARGIIQAGIVSVVYARDYRENQGIDLMLQAGLRVERYDSTRTVGEPRSRRPLLRMG